MYWICAYIFELDDTMALTGPHSSPSSGCMWTSIFLVSHYLGRHDLIYVQVDAILAMGSATGAFQLVTRNICRERWTRTKLIVATFAFVNIAGRLSVAIFGLTFNLKDLPGIEFPIMVSNWTANPNDSPPNWIAFPGNNFTESQFADESANGNNIPSRCVIMKVTP